MNGNDHTGIQTPYDITIAPNCSYNTPCKLIIRCNQGGIYTITNSGFLTIPSDTPCIGTIISINAYARLVINYAVCKMSVFRVSYYATYIKVACLDEAAKNLHIIDCAIICAASYTTRIRITRSAFTVFYLDVCEGAIHGMANYSA